MSEQSGIKNISHWIENKSGFKEAKFSVQALKAYQLKQLKNIVAYVTEYSPFYAKHFRDFQGKGITTWHDFELLPFTTDQDLRKSGLQMLCVSQSAIERIVTLDSSGTTGTPKRIYFTKEDQRLTIDFFKQGMAGITSLGERVLILLPSERPGGIGDLLSIALEELGVTPIKYGVINTLDEALAEIIVAQADIIVGIPIQVLALAKYCELQVGPNPLSFKRILLSTDYVAQGVVKEIQRIWGCEVFRYYGMTEMGLGGGIECTEHNGFHLYEGDFVVEIIDPHTKVVLPPGSYGEVVLTTLTRKGMPLVRFCTGDISRYLPQKCSCGAIIPRLDNIRARKTGILDLGVGSITIADLDELLLELPGVVDFTATVSYFSNTLSLEIEVITLGEFLDWASINSRLKQNETLKLAQEKDLVKILLAVREVSGEYTPQKSKRTISKLISPALERG